MFSNIIIISTKLFNSTKIILLIMKLRAQRVHQMGSSNRDKQLFSFCTKNIFEASHAKSNSSYYKTSQSLPPTDPNDPLQPKTAHPFRGTNVEMQTLRWNTKAKRGATQAQWHLQPAIPPVDLSAHLNEQVSDIAHDFKGKDVNMFKLNQLKRTFVKNNRNRRVIREYFDRFAKQGKVGVAELQDVVKEYGYDISEDEAKIIFRLTGAATDGININQFIDLMARENVHFGTLKVEGTGQPRQHFKERIHLVIRNKFQQLNEAFRIYRMRKEPIDRNKFDYVMKKLDINDLVISKAEREDLFNKFGNAEGHFNAEALFCAVVEQEYTKKPTFPPKLSEFDSNLKVHEEVEAKQAKKSLYFDLKRAANIQFQNQFAKAQTILKQLKKLGKEGEKIVQNRGGSLTRQQLLKQAQNVLRQKGINFTKQEYNCFGSYFDYNNSQQITDQQFRKFLQQTPVKAEQRFDRRLRVPAPIQKPSQLPIYDQNKALQSLGIIRNKKLDTQTKSIFKEFDKDKDGYISRSQFKQKVNHLAVLEGWELQNLVNYFDDEGKGYVNYTQFAKKFDNSAAQTDLNINRQPLSKLKSHSDWLSTKRSYIKQANTHLWNIPSKYSAWPQRLHQTDLSLIQAPSKAGQFIPEQERFNSTEKHNFGQQQKQQKLRAYENKLKKLVGWNEANQQRVRMREQEYEQRCQANDYSMRLTKEIYEQRCHNPA